MAHLLYKPEGRGFDSRWCHWNFLCRNPGVDSVSNRNEYQEYFLGGKGGGCMGLTTFPSSCAVSLHFLEPKFLEISGPVPACQELLPFLYVSALNSLRLPKGQFVIIFTIEILCMFIFFHSRHIPVLMNYYKI